METCSGLHITFHYNQQFSIVQILRRLVCMLSSLLKYYHHSSVSYYQLIEQNLVSSHYHLTFSLSGSFLTGVMCSMHHSTTRLATIQHIRYIRYICTVNPITFLSSVYTRYKIQDTKLYLNSVW